MAIKIGDIVQLRPSYARWYLEHPEICFSHYNKKEEADFDKSMKLHLTCCLGEPVFGKVIQPSRSTENCWLVRWRVGSFEDSYYIGPEHIIRG